MSFFLGCRGRIYHHRRLPDDDVRSAVVLLHEYGEHLGLYDALARRLVADGHAVYAMDAVGHGRSDGERALIESWDHYVDDARPARRSGAQRASGSAAGRHRAFRWRGDSNDDARHLVGQLRQATLHTCPGDLHDVLNEHDRDTVHDVVATFVTSTAAPLPIG